MLGEGGWPVGHVFPTCGRVLAVLDRSEAVAELVLRAVELREGLREVLELLVELLLDLGELLGRERVEVDW